MDIIVILKKFTRQGLAKHSGKNGTPAYIAYKGKVYDVSGSFLWKDGKHQVFHQAGEDLTEALHEAPHGEDMLEKVTVIGVMLKEKS